MIDLDHNNCIVVEAEIQADGFVTRLLQTFLEGAATYGAGFHGCSGQSAGTGRTADEQILAWRVNNEMTHHTLHS
jgi:hypothetical protein